MDDLNPFVYGMRFRVRSGAAVLDRVTVGRGPTPFLVRTGTPVRNLTPWWEVVSPDEVDMACWERDVRILADNDAGTVYARTHGREGDSFWEERKGFALSLRELRHAERMYPVWNEYWRREIRDRRDNPAPYLDACA